MISNVKNLGTLDQMPGGLTCWFLAGNVANATAVLRDDRGPAHSQNKKRALDSARNCGIAGVTYRRTGFRGALERPPGVIE